MLKENVIVLAKKNEKGETRTHLLYLKGNPTPFVVCSNYVEDNTTVSWDWGHYHTSFISALFTMYAEKIKDFYINDLEELTEDEFDHIVNFFTKDTDSFRKGDELTDRENKEAPEVIRLLDSEFERDRIQ